MGVGDPIGFVEGIARGVDMFDCVLPTRYARHGTILTDAGRLNLRNVEHERSPGPLDPDLLVPGVRAVVAGLPASPAAGPGADRGPAAHDAQRALVPELMRRARAAIAGGHLRPISAGRDVGDLDLSPAARGRSCS